MQWYRALLLLIIFLTTIICSLSTTTSYPKPFGRRGSLMFSALVSGSSCPGSTWPGTWRCILGQDTLTVPLSAQVYKWVSTNLMLGGNPTTHWYPIEGGVEILLVASCHLAHMQTLLPLRSGVCLFFRTNARAKHFTL